MRLLLVFLLVPMVLAGDFAKLWTEVEDKLREKGLGVDTRDDTKGVKSKAWGRQGIELWEKEKSKGWGDEKSKVWGDDTSKVWGDDTSKVWGDEKSKGWGDDTSKVWGDDKSKGWGDNKSKGWGDDKSKGLGNDKSKGWGDDKSKGWGDDKSKGWGDDKSKGWGDEKSKDWGDDKSKGWEDNKSKGWGDDKSKSWGDEKSKGWGDEKSKGWGDDKSKGWGDDKSKGWGDDKSKGWGDDKSNGWGDDKSKGWGDEKTKGWGDDKSNDRENKPKNDQDEGLGFEQKKALFGQFREWLQTQDRHDAAQEEYAAQEEDQQFMARNVQKFKDYLKRKEFQESQEREAKQAIYKQMEKIHIKKLLTEKLTDLSHEYNEQKLDFIFSITGHFLQFCKCDSSRDVLERVEAGTFGSPNCGSDAGGQVVPDKFDIDRLNFSMPNSSLSEYMNDPAKKKEKIKWFANLEREEQLKFVLNEYIALMCSSAKQLTTLLQHVEPELAAYKTEKNACAWKPKYTEQFPL